MARMNWDRAAQQYRDAQGFDYSANEDHLDANYAAEFEEREAEFRAQRDERRAAQADARRTANEPTPAPERSRSVPRMSELAIPAPADSVDRSSLAPRSSKRQAKLRRDAAEAARRQLTVNQLREVRRTEAEEARRLSDEAKRLGITVKELKRHHTSP